MTFQAGGKRARYPIIEHYAAAQLLGFTMFCGIATARTWLKAVAQCGQRVGAESGYRKCVSYQKKCAGGPAITKHLSTAKA
jgi:hypothetical protein